MNRPSDLERAMMLLMGVFNKYAGIEGRQDRLSKAEAKTLIEKEFPFFLKGGDSTEVEEMLMSLLTDQDQELDFCEFMCQIALLTIIAKPGMETQLQKCSK